MSLKLLKYVFTVLRLEYNRDLIRSTFNNSLYVWTKLNFLFNNISPHSFSIIPEPNTRKKEYNKCLYWRKLYSLWYKRKTKRHHIPRNILISPTIFIDLPSKLFNLFISAGILWCSSYLLEAVCFSLQSSGSLPYLSLPYKTDSLQPSSISQYQQSQSYPYYISSVWMIPSSCISSGSKYSLYVL